MEEGLEVGRKPCPIGMIIVWVLTCECPSGVHAGLVLPDRASPDRSREAGLKIWRKRTARRGSNKATVSNTSMASGLDWVVKGNPVCRIPFGDGGLRMSIGNENDQVKEGHLVDALACTGDEGRDTLR